MAAKGANRFALFASGEDEEHSSPESAPKTATTSHNPAPGLDSPYFNDNPWEEVKARAGGGGNTNSPTPTTKPSSQKSKARPKTLILRDENTRLIPSVASRPRGTKTNGNRRISNNTIVSSPLTPIPPNENADFHENWCGVCSLKFSSKSFLQAHVRSSPSTHQHYCNLCRRVFKDRNGLQNHVDHALGHEIFCNLCLSAFNNSWGLRNHFENNYSVGHDHGFVCLTCLQGFPNREALDLHLRTAAKHVECTTCHKKFRTQDERDEHWRTTKKHHHCLEPGCDFDAPNVAKLEKHLEEDHFRCEACKRVFPSSTKLHLHVEECSDLRCAGCRQLFPNIQSLRKHESECFKCPQCEFWAATEAVFLNHMAAHSNHEIEYKPSNPSNIYAEKTTPAKRQAKTGTPTHKCFLCSLPTPSHTHTIKHLETGKCPSFPDPSILLLTLGKWWYSVLYMDLDLHAQIRQGRLDMKEMMGWVKEGAIHPYVCRGEGCDRAFGRFSSLVFHVESGECEWDIDRLKLEGLEREVLRVSKERDDGL